MTPPAPGIASTKVFVPSDLKRAVLMALSKNPRTAKDLYADIKGSIEKLYPNKSYAQITQELRDKGVNLRTLVKTTIKEALIVRRRLGFL